MSTRKRKTVPDLDSSHVDDDWIHRKSAAKRQSRRRRRKVMTSFMVTPDLLIKLKVAAAKRGQSLAELLRQAAMQSLRSGGPR
jgi:hypothetical protein